jgi:transketolase N-terminal domain/subunit
MQPSSLIGLLATIRICRLSSALENGTRKKGREMVARLAGKVAVVTGAAPRGEGVGNGMATAIMFAREGAKVVLVNRGAERAE